MVNNIPKSKKDVKDIVSVKVQLSKELHKKLRIKSIQTEQTIQRAIESLISKWVQED